MSSEFFWTSEQLVAACDGELIGANCQFSGVSTDTRSLQAGELYIAIIGESFDGHQFVEQAQMLGAAAVLVSRALEIDIPQIVVQDTRIALGKFAQWHRLQMPVKTVIGITGSNGKTTTKTLLAQLFSLQGSTLATQGNLNNDFGVPRTLLALRPEHEYAVIEMGANHQGEIRYLTHLVQPDIALLNNAAEAHLEGFGSLEGVIAGKGEIFEGLDVQRNPKACAVLNADSPGFEQWLQKLQQLELPHKKVFAKHTQAADVSYSDVLQEDSALSFTLTLRSSGDEVVSYPVKAPIVGAHHASNIAACCAVGLAAGLEWSQMAPVIAGFNGVSGRLQRKTYTFGTLIDDSYNANPASVAAAIETLGKMSGHNILCLGAMAELGNYAHAAHQALLEKALTYGFSQIYLLGEYWPDTDEAHVQIAQTHQEIAQALLVDIQALGRPVNILVKGSRSAKMETISEFLQQQFAV